MIVVGNTAVGTTTDVYGGNGNDVFAVTGDSTLDGSIGPVNIHGGDGRQHFGRRRERGRAFRR